MRWAGAALAVVALSFVVLRALATPASRPVLPTPGVGFQIAAMAVSNPDKGPVAEQSPGGVLGYALHLGVLQHALAQAGFVYEGLRAFPRTAACMLALSSGQVEVAVTGDSPAVLSRARGDKHHAIYASLPSSETWVVARKDGPRSIQELKGKRVGTLLGSTMDYYFRAAAAKLGIDGIEIAQLATSAALPALQNDALDAYLTTAPTAALWHEKYALPVIAKLSEIDPKFRGISITTARDDFLKQNPRFAPAFAEGMRAAGAAIAADREAFYRWESEASGVPASVYRDSDSLRFSDVAAPEESARALEEQLDFRLRTEVANARFDVREWLGMRGERAP